MHLRGSAPPSARPLTVLARPVCSVRLVARPLVHSRLLHFAVFTSVLAELAPRFNDCPCRYLAQYKMVSGWCLEEPNAGVPLKGPWTMYMVPAWAKVVLQVLPWTSLGSRRGLLVCPCY